MVRRTSLCTKVLGFAAFASVLWLSGCAGTETIVARQPQRVQLPQSGEIEVSAYALPPVGNVLPVRVSVKNLAPRMRTLDKPAVYGITKSGERISELALNAPAVVANGEGLLLEVSGGAGALSETLGTMGGKDSWPLLIIGGPIVWGQLAYRYGTISTSSPSSRLSYYKLRAGNRPEKPNLEKGVEYTGYIFLPNQYYAEIELAVVNTLTTNHEYILVPCRFERSQHVGLPISAITTSNVTGPVGSR